MIVVTAPEKYEPKPDDILCFLAGGITKCPDWQKKVIQYLGCFNTEHLVLFNPRRENFPINDPSESERQIKWEFEWLNRADILSFYFCNSESPHPITFYELGRHLQRAQDKYTFIEIPDHVIVSVEKGFSRESDVAIQTFLALNRGGNFINTNTSPYDYANSIYLAYLSLSRKNPEEYYKRVKEFKKTMNNARIIVENGKKYETDECQVCQEEGGRERLSVDCEMDFNKCPYMSVYDDVTV